MKPQTRLAIIKKNKKDRRVDRKETLKAMNNPLCNICNCPAKRYRENKTTKKLNFYCTKHYQERKL